MKRNLQLEMVLKHQVDVTSYQIDGRQVTCRLVSPSYGGIAGSDGDGGVYVSTEVPHEPLDLRYPVVVHEFSEYVVFPELHQERRARGPWDEAHEFAIGKEIEAAKAKGPAFLRAYLDFRLKDYDKYLDSARSKGISSEREEKYRIPFQRALDELLDGPEIVQ